MIYTVTCNPSLDYHMELESFAPGMTNRASFTRLTAGGKGLNVSIVLDNLGVETTALGFAAGFVGREIEARMAKTGCHHHFVLLPEGCSRINVKLKCGGQTTELNASGPEIPIEARDALMRHLEQIQPGDTLVLAGSVPESMPKTIYADWMARLSGRGILFVVDTTGDTLRRALPHKPFLIKPNHHELGELFGVEIHDPQTAAQYGIQLQKMGARNVLVSMSGDGAVLCAESGEVLWQAPAKGTMVNDVGAGDSMIAGFLTGWERTHDYREALLLGAAAGAATAFSEDLAQRSEIEAVRSQLSAASCC